ncbi:AAWKG family protein [Streptomyces spongiicola]|uniref:AAWKG family protein n=1 Tax=Streptomyces spongiicola TaxID=1690221 RepID=UPI0033CACA86
MVERYDPNSADHVGRYDGAGGASTDVWGKLVTHLTGFPVPDRSTVFDTLRSDNGGRLFRGDIKERGLRDLVEDPSGFLRDAGQDYDIWFLDSGEPKKIMQARIVFEGRVKLENGDILFADPGSDNVENAQVREGNEFKDAHGDQFSTIPLSRYMNGPRTALIALRNGSTQGVAFSGLGVPDTDAVNLDSFNTTSESFDFAAKFFLDTAKVLTDWEERFSRDDASWQGESAEIFRSLLRKIRDNYDSYNQTFDSAPAAGNATRHTVYSRALSQARRHLEGTADQLLDAWLDWAKSPFYDPHQVLRYVLDELGRWVYDNNISKASVYRRPSPVYGVPGAHYSSIRFSPQPGFSQVHPEYGDLADWANWAKVGDKAVSIWTRGVDEWLGKPAARIQAQLNNHFVDLGQDFTGNLPQPESTTGVGEEYQAKQLEKQQEELEKQQQEQLDYQDRLRREQEQQREEQLRYQDELRQEQEQQLQEDRAYQEELRRQQEQQLEEDRAAVEENLGGLGDPKAVGEQLLGGLDGIPNPGDVVTESPGGLGDLGDLNGGSPSSGGEQLSADILSPLPQALGGLGMLSTGTGGSVRNPTGGTTRLDGGTVAVDFPDGSHTAFDPDTGLLTTTQPDGTTQTTDLTHGATITNPDGSTTTLDNGLLTTTYPDGTTQTIDPTTGQTTTTQPDGTTTTTNLGTLTDLIGDPGSLNTPTGGHISVDDGDFTTTYPDGSHTAFDPDTGLLTTTRPDGTTQTTDLTHGATITNPDGSTTTLDNGLLTTTYPDGTTQTIDPTTGQTTTTQPDGTTTTTNLGTLTDLGINNGQNNLDSLIPDLTTGNPVTESISDLGNLTDLIGDPGSLNTPTGGHISVDDGDFTTTYPDGSHTAFDPDTGLLTTTQPDGTTQTTDLTHGATITNPDGSTTTLDNGLLTTTYPDGTTQTTDPNTGQTTTTQPDGTTTTTNLGTPTDLIPDLTTGNGWSDSSFLSRELGSMGGNASSVGDVPLSVPGPGTGMSPTETGALLPSGVGPLPSHTVDATEASPLSGVSQPMVDPLATGTGTGTSGMPMGGMPMGGMPMGGMGQGGEKGNGERVRAVLMDSLEESERRNRRRRGPWNGKADEDTFLAPATRVSTASGGSRQEDTEPGGSTTRSTGSAGYLEEDADVWGTEEGGTPAVIGR